MEEATAVKVPVKVQKDGQDRLVKNKETKVRFKDDVVTFTNETEGLIKIHVSSETLFETDRFDVLPGEDKDMIVMDGTPDRYPFAVFCIDVNDYAHGSSMPIIIVDPKS